MDKHKIVLVEWIDSASYNRWCSLEEATECLPCTVKTIGYLLNKNKVSINIAGSIHDGGQCEGTMCIPRQCIISIKNIKA